MPKVVLIMDNPAIPTGYASTCRLTAKELAKRGWEVYAIAFNGGQQGGADGDIFDFNGIKVIPNEALSRNQNAIYGDAQLIEKIHREVDPDVYLFHNDSYRYSYADKLPDEILSRSAFWLPFEGQEPDRQGLGIFGRFPVIRFVTQHALDMHAKHMQGKDIGFVYHAVDMEHMAPQVDKRTSKANKQLGIEDKFVVARVDRHQPRKYWDLTLKAFAKFAEGKDDVFLLCKCNPRDVTMYDEGKKSGLDLEALADSLGLKGKIDFNDYFFDVSYLPQAFYHPADVFLTTTSGEGFGLALVEAMACGVPVIYPDTPVLPEVIGDGGIRFGLSGRDWYEPMKVWHNMPDVHKATEALEKAYGDWKAEGEQLRNIGDKGKQVAEGRYSPQVVYDEWDKILRGLCAERKLASVITILYNVSGDDQIYGDEGINRLKETMDVHVKCDYEWIIIDNGSPAREVTRDWMEKAAAENDRIKAIYLDMNRGYAGGNNVGIAAANGEFVVLLNPDSEAIPPEKHGFRKDFIELMVDRMRSDPGLGILGMETHHRDDVMPGLSFPYFCCVIMSRACLDAVKMGDKEWLDNRFWPAYYEDSLDSRRFVPIRENGQIDVISLENLFQKGEIKKGRNGKEVSILDGIETLSINPDKPCPTLDIHDLPEWWTQRYLSEKEQVAYEEWKTTGSWKEAQIKAGLRGKAYLGTRIRDKIKRSIGEDTYAEWKKIKHVIRHAHQDDMVRVDTKYGQTVCTKDHSLMEHTEDGLVPALPSELSRPCSVTITDKISPDASRDIPIEGHEDDDGFVTLRNGHGVEYKFPGKLNYASDAAPSFFRILGEFVSEGSVSGNRVSFSGKDKEAMTRLQSDWLAITGRTLNLGEYDDSGERIIRGKRFTAKGKMYRISITDKNIAQAFESMCGKGAKNKKIPSFVYSAPQHLVDQFISGIIRGDGYDFSKDTKYSSKYSDDYRNKAFRFSTTSLALVSGFSLLMLIMDRRFSVGYDDEKESYSLDFVMYRKNTRSRISLTDVPPSGWVYDLEVEDYHTFADACGLLVVHNSDFCIRTRAAGFRIEHDGTLPCWHKSGGTNKHLIEKEPTDPEIRPFMATIEKIKKEGLMDFDFERKMGEVTSGGMAGLINGNIAFLNAKWGISARQKVRVVWHTHIGAAVGFSEIAEGFIPELHELGFDVYVNDWSNGANVQNPVIKELIEKTKRAKESGDDLTDAIHVICWLMETFADVNGLFKVGISFCESTKVRDSYLHLCNGMDSIMTFSEFCKTVQKSSGFTAPIHVTAPGVDPVYINYHDREAPPNVAGAERNAPCPCGSGQKFKKCCQGKKFTFLSVGVAQDRKDTQRLVGAFCEAFPKGQARPPDCEEGFPLACNQVELVLKSNNFGELDWVEPYKQRANIRTVFTGWHEKADKKDFSKDEMYDLYCQSHALVHPSHGEGIGMPILEAAATGMPTIFTNWSSPAEYLDDSNSYPCSLSPYAGTAFTKAYPGAPGDNGMWANIHIGHLKHLMYDVIRNYAAAKVKGQKAHEDVKRRFNWKESARSLWPVIMGWHEKKEAKPKMDDMDFNPLTFAKPSMDPVGPGDRVMIDITTRDRRPYLACLLTSLLSQTYRNWDISIQVDDADEGILNDHLVMSLIKRIEHEGHLWRMIRGMRQGPHMSHQRNLQSVLDNKSHKLICRIDDDIYVKPDFLEKLIEPFLQDSACEVGAVGGVYLNPARSDAEQMAPANFREDLNYAGKIEPNVPWPYTCLYPEGTKPRSVEHLYSSFLYRTEIAQAIGGYCKLFSQIGHREESDFSYRFCLAGYKLLIHPEAIGYHFYAPGSGIRSNDIKEKEALANTDHKIYMKRLARWRVQLQEKRDREAQRVQEIAEEARPAEEPARASEMACLVSGDSDLDCLVDAIERFAPISDSIYVTCGLDDTDSVLKGIKARAGGHEIMAKIKMIGNSLRETAQVFSAAWASGSEYVMTVSDQMRFQADPRPLLSGEHDEYVFEVYTTYERGNSNGSGFEADEGAPEVVGPECRNMCLISRNNGKGEVPMERRLYSDMVVIDDQRMTRGPQNKSTMGNPLLRLDEMGDADWTKVCVFQHPHGRCDPPRTVQVSNGSPLVSIIIPTPGRKEYLKQCIDSIYSLTSTSFELILIDNDSSDGTAEMLAEQQKLRPGIQVYRQSTNLGYQKSINIAVERAKGKYLLLFNDDAWVEKPEPDGRDWLKVLIDELESDPKVGLVGPHAGESPALKKPMLFFWCVMLRRSTWDEVGPLDDVTFLNYGGDDDYCERLRMAGYEIRQKYVHLRHMMNLIPPEVKNIELAESRLKLLNKYSVGV